jgi:hypothetical protein
MDRAPVSEAGGWEFESPTAQGEAMTRQDADRLGLKVYRLLTLGSDARLRRLPEEQANTNVVYGLDGTQFMHRIVRGDAVPLEVMQHSTGVPIRPLYINEAGLVKRAVPLDWDWGVDYIAVRDLRAKVE